MKKFHQLLSDDSQNEYGLQYRPIKPTKNLLKNILNSYESRSLENPQTVEIYLRSSHAKSLKMKLPQRTNIQKLKETIQEKLFIPFQDQLIYLNGKQISVFSSITLNQKQIIHITDRKIIVGLHQHLQITLRVFAPKDSGLDAKIYTFTLSGAEKISVLKSILLTHDDYTNYDHSLQFNFLESGRMLSKEESFTENLIIKICDITCLLSQNQVQTKFSNQCQQTDPQQTFSYKRIQNSPTKVITSNDEPKPEQIRFGGLKFNKPRAPTNKFLMNKGKSPIYSKIFQTANDPQSPPLRWKSQRPQNDSETSLTGSGFKKKKLYHEDQESEDSHLMKKIIVHKSREEIQKIASENSLLEEETNEVEEERKSVVSSSSSEQNQTQYIPIRQQKEYRPCPLIPQRKMAPSEKIKINMELQKLFGGNQQNQQSQGNSFSQSMAENEQETREPQIETIRSRVIIKNPSMRNSIGAQDSILRIVKDRKPSNRYGEENLEEEIDSLLGVRTTS